MNRLAAATSSRASSRAPPPAPTARRPRADHVRKTAERVGERLGGEGRARAGGRRTSRQPTRCPAERGGAALEELSQPISAPRQRTDRRASSPNRSHSARVALERATREGEARRFERQVGMSRPSESGRRPQSSPFRNGPKPCSRTIWCRAIRGTTRKRKVRHEARGSRSGRTAPPRTRRRSSAARRAAAARRRRRRGRASTPRRVEVAGARHGGGDAQRRQRLHVGGRLLRFTGVSAAATSASASAGVSAAFCSASAAASAACAAASYSPSPSRRA